MEKKDDMGDEWSYDKGRMEELANGVRAIRLQFLEGKRFRSGLFITTLVPDQPHIHLSPKAGVYLLHRPLRPALPGDTLICFISSISLSCPNVAASLYISREMDDPRSTRYNNTSANTPIVPIEYKQT